MYGYVVSGGKITDTVSTVFDTAVSSHRIRIEYGFQYGEYRIRYGEYGDRTHRIEKKNRYACKCNIGV